MTSNALFGIVCFVQLGAMFNPLAITCLQSMHVRRDFSSKQINKHTDPYLGVGSVAMRTCQDYLHQHSVENENLRSLTGTVESVSLQAIVSIPPHTCTHTTLIATALYNERRSQSMRFQLYRVIA